MTVDTGWRTRAACSSDPDRQFPDYNESGRLTPAEREALRRQVLDERHPFTTEVEYEILAEPSPAPSTDTPWNQAKRRQELLGELWGSGYTRWRVGSYREDDLTKARRRRELNESLTGDVSVWWRTPETANGAVAGEGDRAATDHTPADASSGQFTADGRQKGAA